MGPAGRRAAEWPFLSSFRSYWVVDTMTAYLPMARVCWNSSGAGSLLPRTSSASRSLPAHLGHDAAVAAGTCRRPPGRIILRPVQPRRRTRALPLRSRLRLAKFIQLRHESLILSLNLGALLTLAQVLSISGSMPSSPGRSRAKKERRISSTVRCSLVPLNRYLPFSKG